ncbi:hypothetical protein [Bradyrhizobium sp. CCGE-LA001]|uniref:hypothetical protein n=1 Tax=Bradyrhizobium sp. CCGE-LA001 TaxID=1223566 RepID=UPI00119827D8|nr:hypothetical protein [Bradyrhizobium sp. CCGE-LA001]
MTLDTYLGLFGAATGLLGLFLAYYFYKKSVRTKVLAIAYTDPIPRMVTFGKQEVVYEGVLMRALSTVYLLLWNRGTAPIEASDFLSPVSITASKQVLNLRVHDKDAAADVTLNEDARTLTISLLRPGEAVTLIAEVTSENYTPDIKVEMKSADMSTFIAGIHSVYPPLVAVLTFFILFSVEFAVLKDIIPEPGPTPTYFPFKEDPGALVFVATALLGMFVGVAALSIVPAICSFIAQKLTKAVLARTVTPVAWRFSKLKVSAVTMRTRLKQFRKFIDAEYKKIEPN